MFNNGMGYSLADIAAVTEGANNGNGNGFGWGGDGAWWVILFLFAIFGGWGGGYGFGGNGRNGGSTTTREEISYGFDMNGLENGVRSIQNGLCDGFYAINNAIQSGNAAIQSTLCQGFNGVNTSMLQGFNGTEVAMLQGFNGIQSQLCNDALVAQQCCCETQNLINSNFANLNYNLATQNCDTRRAVADSSRDIIEANNNNTRQIIDFLVNDKLTTLQSENQSLKLAASQATQNATLGAMMQANTAEILQRTAPIPVPAYLTCSPYANYGHCGNSYSNCGCGCY